MHLALILKKGSVLCNELKTLYPFGLAIKVA